MPVPRLDRSQFGRLRRLLDMHYTVSELAREIHISTDAIYRTYIPAGVPVYVDEKKKVWINGVAFREWVKNNLVARKKNKQPMAEDAAYCVRCNAIVTIQKARITPYKRGIRQMSGRCPVCKGMVNRFLKAEVPVND